MKKYVRTIKCEVDLTDELLEEIKNELELPADCIPDDDDIYTYFDGYDNFDLIAHGITNGDNDFIDDEQIVEEDK